MEELDWQIGDLRPVAFALHVMFLFLALVTWLMQKRASLILQKIFPTRRKLQFGLLALAISTTYWVPSENALAQFDDELGWSYVPNNTKVETFGSEGRSVASYFDNIGSRVQNPGMRREPNVPSALFVGGSFTMGHGLPYDESLPGQLDAMPEFPFQTINLGVQGFGTDQALLQLKRHIDSFDTKIVVYVYMSDHVRRNANYDRRLLFPEGRFLGTKPLFGIQADGKPVLKKRPARYDDLRFCWLTGVVQGAFAHWGPAPSPALTTALVQAMNDHAKAKGARFLAVHWDQEIATSRCVSPFQDVDFPWIDTRSDPPAGWYDWKIPGDTHPDVRANRHIAQQIVQGLSQDSI